MGTTFKLQLLSNRNPLFQSTPIVKNHSFFFLVQFSVVWNQAWLFNTDLVCKCFAQLQWNWILSISAYQTAAKIFSFFCIGKCLWSRSFFVDTVRLQCTVSLSILWSINIGIDVFYHRFGKGILGHTTRAPPCTRGGRVQTEDQTIPSQMPWPLGHYIPSICLGCAKCFCILQCVHFPWFTGEKRNAYWRNDHR